MYEGGFEYALTEGWPRNPNPWRYKFTPPCCKIVHKDTYRCAHEWKVSLVHVTWPMGHGRFDACMVAPLTCQQGLHVRPAHAESLLGCATPLLGH